MTPDWGTTGTRPIVGNMAVFVLRVWVPDRPGALGAVASRIGSVGGDLVGIEILERGAGSAIDELIVELPDSASIDALLDALHGAEGVAIETVRETQQWNHDPRVDALTLVADVLESASLELAFSAFCVGVARNHETDWVVVLDEDGSLIHASVGNAPDAPWIAAFLQGLHHAGSSDGELTTPDDIAWTRLGSSRIVAVLGRNGRPFRGRERAQLAALGRIVGAHAANYDSVTRPES